MLANSLKMRSGMLLLHGLQWNCKLSLVLDVMKCQVKHVPGKFVQLLYLTVFEELDYLTTESMARANSVCHRLQTLFPYNGETVS